MKRIATPSKKITSRLNDILSDDERERERERLHQNTIDTNNNNNYAREFNSLDHSVTAPSSITSPLNLINQNNQNNNNNNNNNNNQITPTKNNNNNNHLITRRRSSTSNSTPPKKQQDGSSGEGNQVLVDPTIQHHLKRHTEDLDQDEQYRYTISPIKNQSSGGSVSRSGGSGGGIGRKRQMDTDDEEDDDNGHYNTLGSPFSSLFHLDSPTKAYPPTNPTSSSSTRRRSESDNPYLFQHRRRSKSESDNLNNQNNNNQIDSKNNNNNSNNNGENNQKDGDQESREKDNLEGIQKVENNLNRLFTPPFVLPSPPAQPPPTVRQPSRDQRTLKIVKFRDEITGHNSGKRPLEEMDDAFIHHRARVSSPDDYAFAEYAKSQAIQPEDLTAAEKFRRYYIAYFLIQDAIHYRNPNHVLNIRHLQLYSIYFHSLSRVFLFFLTLGILFLAYFEYPSENLPGSKFTTLWIEFGIVLVFYLELFLKRYFYGHPALSNKWNIVKFVLLTVNLVDLIVAFILAGNNVQSVRVSRIFRVYYLIDYDRLTRDLFLQVTYTLVRMLPVALVFFSYVFLSSVLFSIIFSNGLTSVPDYYNSTLSSFLNQMVLITTANFPDIMFPAYYRNHWYAFFFIAYLAIGLFLGLNFIIALVHQSFRKAVLNETKNNFRTRRSALLAAFIILDYDKTGVIGLDQWEHIYKLIVPKSTANEAIAAFELIDTDANGYLNIREFFAMCDVFLLERKTVQVHAKRRLRRLHRKSRHTQHTSQHGSSGQTGHGSQHGSQQGSQQGSQHGSQSGYSSGDESGTDYDMLRRSSNSSSIGNKSAMSSPTGSSYPGSPETVGFSDDNDNDDDNDDDRDQDDNHSHHSNSPRSVSDRLNLHKSLPTMNSITGGDAREINHDIKAAHTISNLISNKNLFTHPQTDVTPQKRLPSSMMSSSQQNINQQHINQQRHQQQLKGILKPEPRHGHTLQQHDHPQPPLKLHVDPSTPPPTPLDSPSLPPSIGNHQQHHYPHQPSLRKSINLPLNPFQDDVNIDIPNEKKVTPTPTTPSTTNQFEPPQYYYDEEETTIGSPEDKKVKFWNTISIKYPWVGKHVVPVKDRVVEYLESGRLKRITKHWSFEIMVSLLLYFNAIIITHVMVSTRNLYYPSWTIIVDDILIGLGLLEVVLKIIAYRTIKKFWVLFNVAILTISLLGKIIIEYGLRGIGDPIFMLRLACIFRFIRIFRLFASIKRMRHFIQSMFQLTFIFLNFIGIIFVLYYFYAIIGIWAYNGLLVRGNPFLIGTTYDESDYYGFANFNNFESAMITLFHLMVVNNWLVTFYATIAVTNAWSILYFCSFYFLSVVCILNLVIAFLIEAVNFTRNFYYEARHPNKHQHHHHHHKHNNNNNGGSNSGGQKKSRRRRIIDYGKSEFFRGIDGVNRSENNKTDDINVEVYERPQDYLVEQLEELKRHEDELNDELNNKGGNSNGSGNSGSSGIVGSGIVGNTSINSGSIMGHDMVNIIDDTNSVSTNNTNDINFNSKYSGSMGGSINNHSITPLNRSTNSILSSNNNQDIELQDMNNNMNHQNNNMNNQNNSLMFEDDAVPAIQIEGPMFIEEQMFSKELLDLTKEDIGLTDFMEDNVFNVTRNMSSMNNSRNISRKSSFSSLSDRGGINTSSSGNNSGFINTPIIESVVHDSGGSRQPQHGSSGGIHTSHSSSGRSSPAIHSSNPLSHLHSLSPPISSSPSIHNNPNNNNNNHREKDKQ